MAARTTQVSLEVLRLVAPSPGTSVNAATSFGIAGTGSAANPFRHIGAASNILLAATTRGGGDCEVTGRTALALSSNPPAVKNSSVYVSAATSLGLAFGGVPNQTWPASGSSSVKLAVSVIARAASGGAVKSVSASTGVGLLGAAGADGSRSFFVSAFTTVDMPGVSVPLIYALLHGPAASGIGISGVASVRRVANATAMTEVVLASSPSGVRDVFTTATTGLGLVQRQGNNRFWYGQGSAAFDVQGRAVSISGGKGAACAFGFMDRAASTVLMPPGGGAPGGTAGGLRNVLLADVSGEFPSSYAETPSGLILIANGIDPIQRWNGMTGLADAAGVRSPTSALELGGAGVGRITGLRAAYVRFVDGQGNVSNLSPVSNYVDFGRDGLIGNVGYDPTTGRVTVYSQAHGLSANDPVIIEGVQGLPVVNGTFTVSVVDADRFTLNGVGVTGGRYTTGGVWVYGIKAVVYGNVPVPAEPKVVRRQILRNLDGNAETFYVDVDTTDLTSTTFLSTNSDEVLSAGDPVPLYTAEDAPYANRYGVPPSHKALVAAHLGRIFAAGEVAYTRGNARPVFGQPTIVGTGTAWRKSMVGRMVYVAGATTAYEIAAVDEASQIITTTVSVADALGPFNAYAIRPPSAERRFLYFSEPALPEAWPAWNAVSLPEDSDDITGMMVKGSFLFVLENRHIYKLTFESEPSDARVWLTTRRGCVNDRCHVQVEDTAYMLDEVGLHSFDGQTSEPISDPIQNLFQQAGTGGLQVNWQADRRYWHAAHDPVRDTIRWFVPMTGSPYPRHAICYDYRRQRFWIEEYPFAMTSSTVATIGYRRSLIGSEARRVLCVGEGGLDAVEPGNAVRGVVASAGPISLTDSTAPFPPGLAGAPISIASGKGCGQQRKVTSNTADTLEVDRPWLVRPDATSVYQIGGVNWSWQSGWFRYVDEEQDNNRDVELVFQPVKGTSSTNIRLYFDHGDRPRVWSRTIDQDGVSLTAGQPEVTVDMTHRTGYAAHRQTGHRDPTAHGDRFVSIELSGVQAGEPHRVYQITLNGVRPS